MSNQSEFARLVYVPGGIAKACVLVERGREILQHQSEFWKRYAQIEDTYAKSLQNLLSLPCSTWKVKDGIFSKKKTLCEATKAMDQGWKAVKTAVQEISTRHEQIADGLLQQGHIPLEKLFQTTENDVRLLMENSHQTSEAISSNFKLLKKARQQYIKLAQSHKGLNKSLDDPQLAYEKRQKLEIQCSQLKTEVDSALKAYRLLVEQTGSMQRAHYTKTAPQTLKKLEKLEADRMIQTKNTYSKYVANTHTVIPTVRELCDRLIFYTDQIAPPNQISQFVHSILFSLKEPLKAPKVPRFKPFGDANDSDAEDETISSDFHQSIFSIHSSYHDISLKEGTSHMTTIDEDTGARTEPKPVQNDSDQMRSPSDVSVPLDTDANDDTFDVPKVTSISIDDSTPIEKPEIQNAEENNNSDDIEPSDDTKEPVVILKDTAVSETQSGGWVDDFLSGGSTTSGNEEFSVPSSNPFADTVPTLSKTPIFQNSGTKSPRHMEATADLPFATNTLPKSPRKQVSPILKEPEPILKDSNEPTLTTPKDDNSIEARKEKLKEIVRCNDYYQLFGVTASDTLATITQKRKEINKQLHPDNFVPNSAEKQEAVAQLVRINDVFNSVFRNSKTKTLYDKLCAYRKKYDSLLDSQSDLLQRAVTNLNLVGKAVKRANLPSDLYDEVSYLLEMIEDSRGIVPQ